MVGSVFSPYYARQRRRGPTNPLDHCALNIALYTPRGKRWALTERGRGALFRDRDTLEIGSSRLEWIGDALVVDVDEIAAPLPARVRGSLRLLPTAFQPRVFALEDAGRHRWWPIAPCARLELRFESPRIRWSGHAYLDSNWGDAPLERDFSGWNWSRCTLADGGTAVLYDTSPRRGERVSLAIRCRPDGDVDPFEAPNEVILPQARWRVARATRADPGAVPSVLRTLEDTPFYVRSLLQSRLLGQPVIALHEGLNLDRFARPWVQRLLPFRMHRAASSR